MNNEFDEELGPDEQKAFAALRREKIPPAVLEERVVASLKNAGMIGRRETFWHRNRAAMVATIAASLLFFVFGALAMKWFTSRPQPGQTPEFMLVLRTTSSGPTPPNPEKELRIAKEYGNWARQLGQQGVIADGEKLKDETRLLRLTAGRPEVSENSNELYPIGGYFLIKVKNYEEAIKVAETCPHLKYGGVIEVREIDRF